MGFCSCYFSIIWFAGIAFGVGVYKGRCRLFIALSSNFVFNGITKKYWSRGVAIREKIGFHHFCLPITGNASYHGPLLVAGFYSLSLWFHLGIGFDPTPLLRFLLGFSIS